MVDAVHARGGWAELSLGYFSRGRSAPPLHTPHTLPQLTLQGGRDRPLRGEGSFFAGEYLGRYFLVIALQDLVLGGGHVFGSRGAEAYFWRERNLPPPTLHVNPGGWYL